MMNANSPLKLRRAWRGCLGLTVLYALTGCVTPTPPDQQTLTRQAMAEVTLPATWTFARTAGEFDAAALGFSLPAELEALIREAQANNPDLRIAAQRVAQSRSAAKAAGASLLPTLAIGGQVNESVVPSSTLKLNGAGLIANWEIDIWAKTRSAKAASLEMTQSAELDRLYARQSIAAAVVKAWLTAAEAGRQTQLMKDMVALAEKQLELIRFGQKVGRNTQQDVVINQITLKNYQNQLMQSEQALNSSRRALEVLVGRYPAAEVAVASSLPDEPTPLPAGLPSDLAERRPDLKAAESRFRAAFYNVAVARKARLPSISLQAGIGYVDESLLALKENLDNPVSGATGSLLLPLFTNGGISSQIEIRTSQQEEAAVAYARTMLNALNEIEGSLYADQILAERYKLLSAQLADQQKLVELQQAQLKIGKGDRYQLQQQQLTLTSSELSLLRIRNERLIQRVNLHLALGGVYPGTAEPAPTNEAEPEKTAEAPPAS